MLDAATIPRIASTTPSDHHGCGSHRTPPWICSQTHPQAERWAAANLHRQGYQTYLPLVAVSRTDRTVPTLRRRVIVPMFRSYLFVCLQSQHWTPIQHTRGVARVLTCDGQPHHINPSVLEAVRAAEALGAAQPPEITQWAPGAACSLRKGHAFEGLPAVITEIHGHAATIAMLFLGELRTLTVPLDALLHSGDP